MDLPQQGSIWTKGGVEYRVVHADASRVKLVGPTGLSVVPLYEWPAGHAPVTVQASAEPVIAMLVGGSTGRHFDRLWEQAADIGVDLQYHWPAGRTVGPPRLPLDVQLVVMLVSHVPHKTYDAAKLLAKGARVPVARVPSGGFQASLKDELDKLGIETQYGLLPSSPTPCGYRWTGRAWELFCVQLETTHSVVDVVLATALAIGSVFFASR